jgi:putative FmdB family regulatory protein
MPLYDAKCPACGTVKEFFARMAESHVTPECCGQAMGRILSAPMITGDIQPYMAVAIDKKTGQAPVIGSRREHKEFLKRNGYVNVETDSRPREVRGDFNVRKELTEATMKVLGNP